jgi:nucleotide-binding universal stress UspA family protein
VETTVSLSFSSAIDDFHNARRRAAMEEIMARFTGKSADLLSFDEVSQKLGAKGYGPRVLRDIPLNAIVGSVGRYYDFTRSFLPRQDSDKERWASIEVASASTGLPPIEVYQIGQVYFVLDGNHRVSVARQRGATFIMAYVTEVQTKVPLTPDTQPDDMILKAEYAEFLERTHLDEIRPGVDLSVTVPGQYAVLEGDIQIHCDLMSLRRRREVPYQEAVGHWYDRVYWPVVQLIRERGILQDLPGRTETDLYLWILEHRSALEEELGWPVRPEAAAADLAKQFGPRRVVSHWGEKILGAVRPELVDGPSPGQWRKEQLAARQDDRLFADILVSVSGKEVGWQALEQALQIAQREEGRLLGLHVVTSDAQRSGPKAQAVQAEFNRRCAAAGVPGNMVIEAGVVARQICDRARWADLVIVNLAYPPAPQPVARLKSGFRTLIRRSPRPVLAVPRAWSRLERALLAYDGSPQAKEALFVATYLAARWRISLTVVTVVEAGRATADTLLRAANYLEEHGVEAALVQQSGPVAETILKVAQVHQSDLLIMGSYGHGPVLEVMLGSAVDQVLRASPQPILVCR